MYFFLTCPSEVTPLSHNFYIACTEATLVEFLLKTWYILSPYICGHPCLSLHISTNACSTHFASIIDLPIINLIFYLKHAFLTQACHQLDRMTHLLIFFIVGTILRVMRALFICMRCQSTFPHSPSTFFNENLLKNTLTHLLHNLKQFIMVKATVYSDHISIHLFKALKTSSSESCPQKVILHPCKLLDIKSVS